MNNKDWETINNGISNIQKTVQNAVDSKNFQELNRSITYMVNKTLSQYQAAVPRYAEKLQPKAPRIQIPDVYGEVSGYRTGSILQIVFGGITCFLCGSTLLGLGIMYAIIGGGGLVPLGILSALTAGSLWAILSGSRKIGKINRFKKYKKALGAKTYCSLTNLAKIVQKPVKYVLDDVNSMIEKGWFLEGHVDDEKTCLITSNETYRQYRQTKQQAEEARRVQAQEEEHRQGLSPQVRDVLTRGNRFLDRIHALNDAIPGIEISNKISKMEQIIDQIFQRVEEHPESVSELKRMMDYYLPTTIKLLEAYEEMDGQVIQGENIQNSKKEIEATLDTLNAAFEKLLNSIFQDTAWDVASDISVLNTILAQEGLAGDDFGG